VVALRGLQNQVHLSYLSRGEALLSLAGAERDHGTLREAEPQGGGDGRAHLPRAGRWR
jgi:hypothetical protein